MRPRYLALLLAAIAVGLVTALVLGRHSPKSVGASVPPTGSASPMASPSLPSPTPPAIVIGPVPGVAVPVCHVSSVRADFGIGPSAKAFVYSISTGAKCDSGQGFVVVTTKAGTPSAPFGPLACKDVGHCRILATPDVNGDGRADLAVGHFSMYWMNFDLFQIEKGNPPRIVPYAICHASGKLTPLIDGRALSLGGTTQVMYGVICGPTPGAFETWGAAETIEGNGPYRVEQWIYKMEGSTLIPVSSRSWMLAQSQHELLPQRGGLPFDKTLGLCGQPLLH